MIKKITEIEVLESTESCPTPNFYVECDGKFRRASLDQVKEFINVNETGGSETTGAPGKSAYELAVEQGFVGTLEEWLGNLKGEPGETGTPGEPGKPGASGEPGKSAYEIAVEHGYTGTEEDWSAALMSTGKTPITQYAYCSGRKLYITKKLNVFSTNESLSETVYWPWLIKTEGLIENPLGKYYLYYSTDHGATAGYVSLAYSDHILGPFTDYGRIYKNGNSETETPSVVWDEYNQQFIMYIHCAGAYVGEDQTTFYVTSKDGITWSTPTKALTLNKEKLYGNLHNGYFHPFRIGNQYFAYSLMGGNNAGSAVSYSEDGYHWVTDHNQLGYWCLKDNMYIPPHHGTIVSKWGQIWWIGLHQNFASGVEEKAGSVVMIPMQDLYTPIGQPIKLFDLEDATYEDPNIRQVTIYQEGTDLYIWYQCANYFNVAILSEGEANIDQGTGGSDTPIDPNEPVTLYTSVITGTSDNSIDGNGTMKKFVSNPIKPGKYKFKITIDNPIEYSATDNTSTVISFKLASSTNDVNGTEIIRLQRSDMVGQNMYETEVEILETRPYLYLYFRPFLLGSTIEILYKNYDSTATEPEEPTDFEVISQFTTPTSDSTGTSKIWMPYDLTPGLYSVKFKLDTPFVAYGDGESNAITMKKASSASDNVGEGILARQAKKINGLSVIETNILITDSIGYLYLYFRPYMTNLGVTVSVKRLQSLEPSSFINDTLLTDTISDAAADTFGSIRKWVGNPFEAGKKYQLSFVLNSAPLDLENADYKVYDFKYASSDTDNAGTSIASATIGQLVDPKCIDTCIFTASNDVPYLYLYFKPGAAGNAIRVFYQEVV